MENKFEKHFSEIVLALKYQDKQLLEHSLDKIIVFINKLMNNNYKINHTSPEEISNKGTNAFMYSLDKEVYYCTDYIFEIRNQIIKKSKAMNQQKYYNDITFSMYLISSLIHELCHCKQSEEYETGTLTESAYLNSMSKALTYFNKINYLDKTDEGEAYGNGVAIMRSLYNNYLENDKYKQVYASQLSDANMSFFQKNIMFNEAVYYLDKIPYIKTEKSFENIYTYANNYIANKIDKNYRNLLIKAYPTLILGIDENNDTAYLKNPEELVDQYLANYIKYNGATYKISEKGLKVLEKAYIYLLIPKLNDEIYNKLVLKYGEDKINTLLKNILNEIEKQKKSYLSNYRESYKRVKKIRTVDTAILQDIDEKYATDKYLKANTYLDELKRKIENLISTKNKKTQFNSY